MDDLTLKFKETEAKYKLLKDRLNKGEISAEQMKSELMKMMVQDANGKYWMMGGKTGKWYIHNGKHWQEGDPYEKLPSVNQQPMQPTPPTISQKQPTPPSISTFQRPYQSLEKEPEVTEPVKPAFEVKETDRREKSEPKIDDRDAASYAKREYDYINCKVCKSRIPPYAVYCNFCGANQKELDESHIAASGREEGEDEIVIKSIKYLSFMFFLGAVGAFIGVILGALFGIFKTFLPGLEGSIPDIINITRGKVAGGLVFGAIGGIGTFILFAILSFVLSSVYNLISLIFGGIRFKIKHK